MTDDSRRVRCPSCGAEILFLIGSSTVAICRYCRTAVGRGDLSVLGQVAEIIPTGSKLSLGTRGKFGDSMVRLMGRVQLRWEHGVWDEWYAHFNDGRWGSIAEAGGHYWVSFPVPNCPAPAYDELRPGSQVTLEGVGPLVATDFKTATLASAEGELPEGLTPTRRTVDLEGEGGVFATIDYGDGSAPPEVFAGRPINPQDQQLSHQDEAPLPPPKAGGQKLVCPQCQGAVDLRVPGQARRVACAYCGALLDVTQGGLRYLAALERLRTEPKIPIGAKGKLRGVDYLVVGYMLRRCKVEGIAYDWEEYLLHAPASNAFFWLVDSNGHWSFVRQISAAGVKDSESRTPTFERRRYRRFSSVTAYVVSVLGEFTWEVTANETCQAVDYIAPPYGLSCEKNQEEINWSHAIYVEPGEIETAFGVKGLTAKREGVGAMQPWPYVEPATSMLLWGVFASAAALGLSLVLGASSAPTVVTTLRLPPVTDPLGGTVALPEDAPERRLAYQTTAAELRVAADAEIVDGGELGATIVGPEGEPALQGTSEAKGTQSFLSQPFTIPAHQNLEIELHTNVSNAWAYAGGALIQKDTGESDAFDLEASYYAGADSDGSWSEGSRNATTHLSAVPEGPYVLKVDYQWEPNRPRPAGSIALIAGASRPLRLILLLLLLWLPPLLLGLHKVAFFEKSRWSESTEGG